MVRSWETIYEENERLESLIEKKEKEIRKLQDRIQRNRELMSKKKEIEDRTVSAYVEECTLTPSGYHTTIRIIETGETHPYWGKETPHTYIKITNKLLEQLRECKKLREQDKN